MTRPFTSYHNFWPSDLDLEIWITHCFYLNLLASRQTSLSSDNSRESLAYYRRFITHDENDHWPVKVIDTSFHTAVYCDVDGKWPTKPFKVDWIQPFLSIAWYVASLPNALCAMHFALFARINQFVKCQLALSQSWFVKHFCTLAATKSKMTFTYQAIGIIYTLMFISVPSLKSMGLRMNFQGLWCTIDFCVACKA